MKKMIIWFLIRNIDNLSDILEHISDLLEAFATKQSDKAKDVHDAAVDMMMQSSLMKDKATQAEQSAQAVRDIQL